jgi:hypothetical protein
MWHPVEFTGCRRFGKHSVLSSFLMQVKSIIVAYSQIAGRLVLFEYQTQAMLSLTPIEGCFSILFLKHPGSQVGMLQNPCLLFIPGCTRRPPVSLDFSTRSHSLIAAC